MHDKLTRDTNKKIEATPENLLYIFGTDPVIGKVRFDTRRGEVVDTRLSGFLGEGNTTLVRIQ